MLVPSLVNLVSMTYCFYGSNKVQQKNRKHDPNLVFLPDTNPNLKKNWIRQKLRKPLLIYISVTKLFLWSEKSQYIK